MKKIPVNLFVIFLTLLFTSTNVLFAQQLLEGQNYKIVVPSITPGGDLLVDENSDYKMITKLGETFSDPRLYSDLYRANPDHLLFEPNIPEVSCFETSSNGSSECETGPDFLNEGGMVKVCGPGGCYDRARFEIDTKENPLDTLYGVQISTDDFEEDIRYIDGTTFSPKNSKNIDDYKNIRDWEENAINIFGLEADTEYFLRITALNGDLTESNPSESVSATTSLGTMDFRIGLGERFFPALSGWEYNKKITVDSSKIEDSLSNFPVLVRLNSNNFEFEKAMPNGEDIRFTSADGTMLLKYERERHDSVNEIAEYWVRVPSISNAQDTQFNIHYGKEDAEDASERNNVWDSNTVARWSMSDYTADIIEDSTQNNLSGSKKDSNQPLEINGKVFTAQSFDGVDDFIDFGKVLNNVFNENNPWTISQWVNYENGYTYYPQFSKGTYNQGPGITIYGTDGRIQGGDGVSNSYDESNMFGESLVGQGWKHTVLTYDGTTFRAYLDGEAKNTLVWSHGIGNTSEFDLWMGKFWGSFGKMQIDESRIYDASRNSSWIKAEFHSTNDTLLSYGEEEMDRINYNPPLQVHFDAALKLIRGANVKSSNRLIWTRINTNSIGGITVVQKGEHGGLYNSDGEGYLIESINGNLDILEEGIGLKNHSTSQLYSQESEQGLLSTLTVLPNYSTEDNNVGIIDNVFKKIYESNGPIDTGQTSLEIKTKVALTTPEGEYNENITFVLVAKY